MSVVSSGASPIASSSTRLCALRSVSLLLSSVTFCPWTNIPAGVPAGGWDGLEHHVDERLLGRQVRPFDAERHGAPDERLARAGDAVHDVVDALQIEFWKCFGQGLADQRAPSDEASNASLTIVILWSGPSTNAMNPGACSNMSWSRSCSLLG